MATDRLEWVEIVEPTSRSIMYANLTTGQCVWEPPSGTLVKKFDDNQWWELFDPNTCRFYYYNATSQKTVWHKPQNCDIIPLAKLQQIKQNTEVCDAGDKSAKDSTATQTSKAVSEIRSAPSKIPAGTPVRNSSFSSPIVDRNLPRQEFPSRYVSQGQPCTCCCMQRLCSLQRSDPPQGWKVPYPMLASSMTQTSPAPSPGMARKSSHHHHHHRHDAATVGGHHHRTASSCSHHHHHNHEGTPTLDDSYCSGRIRRSSQSSQGSFAKPYKESGRVSDSSITRSVTILGAKAGEVRRESLRGNGSSPSSAAPCSHHVSQEAPQGSRLKHSHDTDSHRCLERPREMPLSRSYSFMSRPPRYYEEDIKVERCLAYGMRSVESTPQSRRRHTGLKAIASSPESSRASYSLLNERQRSDSSGLDSVATPMMRRKRSVESGKVKPVVETEATKLLDSDSSGSSPSPRRGAFVLFDSPKCPDSGASTLTDKDTRSQYGRGSADSSPHSQVDSGLVSGTTGSRGSADSGLIRTYDSRTSFSTDNQGQRILANRVFDPEIRRCCHHKRHHCNKHRLPPVVSSVIPPNTTTDSDDRSDTLRSSSSSLQHVQSSGNSQNHNSSSASSTTAKQASPQNNSPQSSPVVDSSKLTRSPLIIDQGQPKRNLHKDITHLYSNIDYVYDQPVYQYIMEQAKLSGYRFGDPLYEDGESLHSDDSGEGPDDSDEFADDEGMSNADSSSQEYLDDVNYLADDETYTQLFKPSATKTKTAAAAEDTSRKEPEIQPPSNLMANLRLQTPDSQQNIIVGSTVSASGVVHQNFYSNVPNELPSGVLKKKDAGVPVCSPMQEKVENSNVNALWLMKKQLPETGPGSNLMEKYAEENLNIHTRGILRKKVPVLDMISWTKDPIRKPMLMTIDKTQKTQACEMFKLVQIYMSDRKPKPDMTLNSVGLDIVTIAYNDPGLRDELFVQVCRQTTENHKRDSLRRGWELMAICLEFFPPSDKFCPYLDGYINRHCDPSYHTIYPEISKWPIHIQINHYAGVCSKRLERASVNAKNHRLKKPTLDEIDLARLHIFRASMFGGTLEETMALQRERYPHRRLPWVQTSLSEEVLRLQGTDTEGIFRVPADFDEVNHLKQIVDQWEVGECRDPHVMAALLKLWYRELYEPLIPDSLYDAAIESHEHPSQAVAIVNQLPEINRLVLAYLIRFLQYFSQTEIVAATKMDSSNLAMVMAPNCLRCTSNDPKIIYENTRKEMAFIRTLIQHLDTSFMEGLV